MDLIQEGTGLPFFVFGGSEKGNVAVQLSVFLPGKEPFFRQAGEEGENGGRLPAPGGQAEVTGPSNAQTASMTSISDSDIFCAGSIGISFLFSQR